jgi:hypothetical protein
LARFALELAALDEAVDQLQHLALLGRVEPLDGQAGAGQAAVALLPGQALPGRRAGAEIVDRHAQGLADRRQQGCRRRGSGCSW